VNHVIALVVALVGGLLVAGVWCWLALGRPTRLDAARDRIAAGRRTPTEGNRFARLATPAFFLAISSVAAGLYTDSVWSAAIVALVLLPLMLALALVPVSGRTAETPG
jgi:hypothetical protein